MYAELSLLYFTVFCMGDFWGVQFKDNLQVVVKFFGDL